jgi:hypothetical protein
MLLSGCLGLVIGAQRIRADPVTEGKCTTQACDKQAKINTAPCPFKPGTAEQWCVFDKAKGNLVWCDGTDGFCTLVEPTESNYCTGYCEFKATLACETAKYTKCK